MTPERAIKLWTDLLEDKDDRARLALGWVLESVVIDDITNRMRGDEDFAKVIGNRVAVLNQAMREIQTGDR